VNGLHQLPALERRLRVELVDGRGVGVGVAQALPEVLFLAGERPQQTQADVLDYREQPKQYPGIAHHVRPLGELDERLLHGVVGVEAVAADPQTKEVDAIVIRAHQVGQRLIVAGGRRGQHLLVSMRHGRCVTGQVDLPISR